MYQSNKKKLSTLLHCHYQLFTGFSPFQDVRFLILDFFLEKDSDDKVSMLIKMFLYLKMTLHNLNHIYHCC